MKKVYEAPKIEVEAYELSSSIANNCAIPVTNGPAIGSHQQCDDFKDPFAMGMMSMQKARARAVHNVQFYEDTNCDCYYSAGDAGYWMS